MKTWVKLYTEMLNDPKMAGLTWAERGLWCSLIALAGQIDDRDEDDQATGLLGTRIDVAWCVRSDPAELYPMFDKLASRGLLTEAGDRLTIRNYAKRQAIPDSAKHDAVTERVRQWRAKRNASVTPLAQGCNASVTEPEQNREEQNRVDKSRADESRLARAQNTPPQPDPRPPPLKIYSELTGIFPNPDSPQRQAILDTVGITPDDLERWRYAIKAWLLCDYKRTNVSGILRWYTDGVPNDKRSPGVKVPRASRMDPDFVRAIAQTEARLQAEEDTI